MTAVMVYEVCINGRSVKTMSTETNSEACWLMHSLADDLNKKNKCDDYYVSSYQR